jgi:hypothetical protein
MEQKELRSFGLIVGGIFAAIALWPVVVRSAAPRWWALIVAGLLILPALVYPAALFWPHKGWMFLGHILGWINTRIILGLVFYAIVTPIGIFRRMLGKDPMGRQIRPDLDTYRVKRDPRPPTHLTKQY